MENNETKNMVQQDDVGASADASQSVSQQTKSIEFLSEVYLNISVEVGRTKLMVKDLLQMREGYVIELDKMAGEPLDLYVNSRLIARGEAVMVNDKFGLRLTEVVSPTKRIESLG